MNQSIENSPSQREYQVAWQTSQSRLEAVFWP